ncbi:GNAT family N-acetyltransferase [Secundilactobacillus kimchicus]|uniref:GNAT family N-acetyltransferase n=1 Tax=Secundilactobacillus kimchicus TaxID=528209 RepID=UPI0024A9FCF8|nr:GNAT family N-acetyltransferase [Secundilactobacillus kimchicus]
MINYSATVKISSQQLIELFEDSGIQRPTNDKLRVSRMINNANLLYTSWDGETLVGVARGFSDQAYCCYLSDLAIKKDYQKQGIGQQLIQKIHSDLGPNISLVLTAAPTAKGYYPKVGFENIDSGFKLARKY